MCWFSEYYPSVLAVENRFCCLLKDKSVHVLVVESCNTRSLDKMKVASSKIIIFYIILYDIDTSFLENDSAEITMMVFLGFSIVKNGFLHRILICIVHFCESHIQLLLEIIEFHLLHNDSAELTLTVVSFFWASKRTFHRILTFIVLFYDSQTQMHVETTELHFVQNDSA